MPDRYEDGDVDTEVEFGPETYDEDYCVHDIPIQQPCKACILDEVEQSYMFIGAVQWSPEGVRWTTREAYYEQMEAERYYYIDLYGYGFFDLMVEPGPDYQDEMPATDKDTPSSELSIPPCPGGRSRPKRKKRPTAYRRRQTRRHRDAAARLLISVFDKKYDQSSSDLWKVRYPAAIKNVRNAREHRHAMATRRIRPMAHDIQDGLDEIAEEWAEIEQILRDCCFDDE